MTDKLSSLSVVLVVGDTQADVDLLGGLAERCAAFAVDTETIFVANGVGDATSLALARLVERTPDALCLFLAARPDHDQARLIGIDNAVSDYVLLATPTTAELTALPVLVATAQQGYDIVVTPPAPNEGGLAGLLRRLFFAAYERLSGLHIRPGHATLRLLSRAAALYIAGHPNGEMLLKADAIGRGFPATQPAGLESAPKRPPRGLRDSLGQAVRAVIGASSLPLRMATLFSLIAGAFSLLYSFYVVAIYLFAPYVAPGWTTLSMQVSVMMFLFSVVLLLLAEYILQIHAINPGRGRRARVTRELRSPLARGDGRLNVVDPEGTYQLGAPRDEPLVVPALPVTEQEGEG